MCQSTNMTTVTYQGHFLFIYFFNQFVCTDSSHMFWFFYLLYLSLLIIQNIPPKRSFPCMRLLDFSPVASEGYFSFFVWVTDHGNTHNGGFKMNTAQQFNVTAHEIFLTYVRLCSASSKLISSHQDACERPTSFELKYSDIEKNLCVNEIKIAVLNQCVCVMLLLFSWRVPIFF